MIDTIEVTIGKKKYKYNKDVTLAEIYTEFEQDFEHPILIARVNNSLKELNYRLQEDCAIEFLDLLSHEGNKVHINGLTLLLVCAVRNSYGKNANVKVQHSLDKGIYFHTSFKITEIKLSEIKAEMKRLIKKDLPISKLTIDRLEAIKYYEEIGWTSKSEVLKYNTDNYITLYRLGNVYDYFYYLMPISTGQLKEFDLTYIKDKGLVLRFPTTYSDGKIKKYQHHPDMFDAFSIYREWAKLMKIENATDLNKYLSSGKIVDLIKIDEVLQSNRLLYLAKDIYDKKNKTKIVLIAGPSSSGKTTTSRKLCMYLESFGLQPKAISMDDYFRDRKDTPKNEFGEYDYESLEAMDLELFDKQIASLLKGERIKVPTYNFIHGIKEYHNELELDDNDILIIEGIHALDNKILTNISRDKKFKIYICPLTELNLDNHNRVPTTDNRLLRRIIRDNRTRNYNVEHTLEQWPKVRAGEEKYIFPYQDEADATVNSAAIYEIGVLKTYVEPLLYAVDNKSPYYEEAKRLLNLLRVFLPITSDAIPEDAVIREFIGGSYFHD